MTYGVMDDVGRLSNDMVWGQRRLLSLPPPLGGALYAEREMVPLEVSVHIFHGADGLRGRGGQAEEGIVQFAKGMKVGGGGQEEFTLCHASLVDELWEGRVDALGRVHQSVAPTKH